jgi:hypothetical protein
LGRREAMLLLSAAVVASSSAEVRSSSPATAELQALVSRASG